MKTTSCVIIFILALLFLGLFPFLSDDITLISVQSKAGIKRRAIQISVIHYDLHRATCAQTLIYPDRAVELNLIIFKEKDHKSAPNL